MASIGGKHAHRSDLARLLQDDPIKPPLQQPPQHVERIKRSSGDLYWSRLETRAWSLTLLMGTCLLYCARTCLPISVVSMSGYFGWDKRQSGFVLGSFFWGYCLTQVAGGHLSDKVGGEKVILLSALSWGFITAVTPLVAHVTRDPLLLVSLLRFLKGLLQGVHFPALASLFSQRVRENERAFICSIVGCGSQLGTLLIGGVGSVLLEWYGWESVFYFAGFLTLTWGYCLSTYLLKKGVVSKMKLSGLSSSPSQDVTISVQDETAS